MNKILIACVAALSLFSIASCKKKGGGAAGDYVAKFEGWKTDMCKCKAGDTACSQKVLDDQKKYADEMAKTADKDAKPDPAEAAEMAKKMEPIMAEYTKCMTAAMTPAAPPAGSDAKPAGSDAPPAGSDAKPAGSDAPPAGSAAPPAAGDTDAATKKFVADYGAVKDKLCACADKACTTKLKAEADELEKTARKTLPKPTGEQRTEFKALEKAVNECAKKYK
jgi:hypothetical protein